MMIDLSNGDWLPFSEERTKALGVFPNQLWKNGNAGALVVMKPKEYAEYPLSKVGLDYLLGVPSGLGGLTRLMSPWPLGKASRW